MKNNFFSRAEIGRDKITAIIAAGGIGQRFRADKAKQFVDLLGKPILVWSLEVFQVCNLINEIIVVIPGQYHIETYEMITKYNLSKVTKIIEGGKKRSDSVYLGLLAADQKTDVAVIHDGARPLITAHIISKAIGGLKECDGTVVAVPVTNTIKESFSCDQQVMVHHTLNREHLWSVQTPQVFRYKILLQALSQAQQEGFSGTDDASYVEHYGGKIKIVEGSYKNIKITTPEDIRIAEVLVSLDYQ